MLPSLKPFEKKKFTMKLFLRNKWLRQLNLIAMILVLIDTCKIQMRMVYTYNKTHIEHIDMKSSHSEIIEIVL